MDCFNSILVDIDTMATAHPAMDRGVELARTCGAKLKIVDVLALPFRSGQLHPNRRRGTSGEGPSRPVGDDRRGSRERADRIRRPEGATLYGAGSRGAAIQS